MENQYDPKENYLKILNDYKEAQCRIRISGQARQILDAIERMTFGWKIKWAEISFLDFRQMTVIDNWHISRAIKHLLKMRIIIVANNSNSKKLSYRIETDYTQWRSLPKKATNKKTEQALPIMATTIVANKGDKLIANNGNNQQAYIKDTSKDILLKTDDDDIILSLTKEQLQTKKTDLEESRKEQHALHQNVQHYSDAIEKIDIRLKQLSPSRNKISRSERKKISGKKRARVERLDA